MPIQLDRAFPAHALLGEGALWDHQTQTLYWLDINGQKIFRYDPAHNTNTAYPVPTRPSTIVPRTSGGHVIGIPGGIAALTLDHQTHSANLTELAMPERDLATNRMNDGKCDPAGRLWIGSMSKPRGLAHLWRFDDQHQPTHILAGVSTSNGLVWTANQKTMYYIDSPTGRIDAFDYDHPSGNISNRRPAVLIPEPLGHPDGMTIDTDGMLWVALWAGGAVLRFNPTTGQQLARIEIPGAQFVSSCAFGGPNLDQLYITTASHKVTDPASQPEAGNLFVATNLPATGLEAQPYIG